MKTRTIRDATLADLDELAGILREFHEERGTALNLRQARAAVAACIGDSGRDLIENDDARASNH